MSFDQLPLTDRFSYLEELRLNLTHILSNFLTFRDQPTHVRVVYDPDTDMLNLRESANQDDIIFTINLKGFSSDDYLNECYYSIFRELNALQKETMEDEPHVNIQHL